MERASEFFTRLETALCGAPAIRLSLAEGLAAQLEKFAQPTTAAAEAGPIGAPLAEAEKAKLARLQRSYSRRKKGSRNRDKSRRAIAAFHAKVRRRRMDPAHKVSRKLASGYSHVAFEDLRLKNMTASARGTVEEP